MVKSSYENSNYKEDDSKLLSGLLEYLKEKSSISEEEIYDECEMDIGDMPPLDIYNQNTIYFIAGYVLNSIMQKSSNCCSENCFSKFVVQVPPNEVYSTLTELRDFTGHSLTYVNFDLYIFFVQMARIFLYNLNDLINIKHNIKVRLSNMFKQIEAQPNSCEKARNILQYRFATFCLRISCSKRRPIREYSSLSMSNSI